MEIELTRNANPRRLASGTTLDCDCRTPNYKYNTDRMSRPLTSTGKLEMASEFVLPD